MGIRRGQGWRDVEGFAWERVTSPRLGNAKPTRLAERGTHAVRTSLLRPERGRNYGWPERTDAGVGQNFGSRQRQKAPN